MRQQVLVTIVIAAFDSEKTIEKCLLSIKQQTYLNIDIVVVDSLFYDKAKQPRCKKIIEKYARYFQDGPERSIQRNRGIKEAKGEYILIIDQDMYLTPNVVKECCEKLDGNIALTIPEISIGEGYWVKCIALERYISTYLEKGLNECCRFFRKKDALSIGGYDPKMVGVEDSDFHNRMKEKGEISKIENHIYHDEGIMDFWTRIKKRYYYSKSSRNYIKKYSFFALVQFFPIKPAYFKHWKVLLKNPRVAVGMFFLKGSEAVALSLGLLRGLLLLLILFWLV
jgi:glycosyltransferase involved in cell wall biosynthesis